MDNYFSAEPAIVERLSTIEDLIVKTTAGVSALQIKALGAAPTAVVAFGGDEVPESHPRAIRSLQQWDVYLLLRGALPARTSSDGDLVQSIVEVLHGWEPTDDHQALELVSITPDYDDNLRQYCLSFKTQITITFS
jgi:hypothetical protein